jgi:hypothetical protein
MSRIGFTLNGGARRDRTDDLNTASVRKPNFYGGLRKLGKLWVRYPFDFLRRYLQRLRLDPAPSAHTLTPNDLIGGRPTPLTNFVRAAAGR